MADVRGKRLIAVVCAVTAPLAALTACSGGSGDTEVNSRSASSSATGGPDEAPASRSGDLGQEDLPAPEHLGPGWEYRVDPGNAEDGYVGSGEPAIARDPASVIAAVTPLGCRPRALPEPARALEVTYQRGKVPGVGLVLQFDESGSAQDFFNLRSRVLDECGDARRVELDVVDSSADTVVSTRTEQLGETPSWVEAMTVDDREITLLAVADPSVRSIATVTNAVD